MEKIIKNIGICLVILAVGLFVISITCNTHKNYTYINGKQIITSDKSLTIDKKQAILNESEYDIGFLVPVSILTFLVGIIMIFYSVKKTD